MYKWVTTCLQNYKPAAGLKHFFGASHRCQKNATVICADVVARLEQSLAWRPRGGPGPTRAASTRSGWSTFRQPPPLGHLFWYGIFFCLNIFFTSGVDFPIYPEIFFIITHWSFSASGSLWEIPDLNPGPLSRSLVHYQWAIKSP